MMFGLYLLLTLASLTLAAAVSRSSGWHLWLALSVLGWVVGQFNTLLEAVVFSVMPWRDAVLQLAVSLPAVAVLSAVALLVSGKWRRSHAKPAALNGTIVSLALISLAYQLLYWTAGTIVWPFIAEFYADKAIPSVYTVFALQVPRALIFVAAAWLWLRTSPKGASVVLGIAYALIGGIAPLLPENPYMTPDVRFAHAIETGSSNFLFGMFVAWLLTRARSESDATLSGGAHPANDSHQPARSP